MTEMMCEGCSQGVNTAREKAVDEQREKETEQKREETENSIQWMQTPPQKTAQVRQSWRQEIKKKKR